MTNIHAPDCPGCKKMKVYLDDLRDTPEGWVRCYWPNEVIELLKTNQVSELSLDHDLGDQKTITGYDVLLWIEEQVITNNFKPPSMKVHSSNPAGRARMEAAIRSIQRFTE